MRNADAARMLREATDVDALVRLARRLGFASAFAAPPKSVATALGAADGHELRVGRGPGALRCLVVRVHDGEPARSALQRIARRLAAGSVGPLWLVLLVTDATHEMVAAAWSGGGATLRIAALVVDPRHVRESDAETICALAAAIPTRDADGGDALAHGRWLDVLGREALSRRFYHRLERAVGTLARTARGRADASVRDELALLATSRLLFLTFLESKGWLDGDRAFLRRRFDACMASGGGFHARVLRPLFFGTLNTPVARRAPCARAFGAVPFLNGGLFAPTPLERRHRTLAFDDAALGGILGDLLSRFRFTARETTHDISEAAVDPEMLGRAFESLMAPTTRRATGAFYTPHALVARVVDDALRAALARDGGAPPPTTDAIDRLLHGEPLAGAERAWLGARLDALRVLDPACGSGAFLVQALERMAELRVRAGDARPIATVRRDVLAASIFGVDVNATAVWLCELRLWLAVVIETTVDDPLGVPPLPNLDRNVRVGDALAAAPSPHGWGGDPWVGGASGACRRIAALRRRYVAASGARKLTLAASLERAERAAAVATLGRALATRRAERAGLLAAARGRDLFGARRGALPNERARLAVLRGELRALGVRRRALLAGGALPFGFAWHFAELAGAGVDAVVGNPPWVRPHALDPRERAALRAAYESCRGAAWSAGAALARAGRGFAGQVDLAAPFVERSLALVREGGVVAMVLPAKLWRTLAGGGLRRLLAREAHVDAIADWSDAPPLFDAATYPSLLVATRGRSACPTAIEVHRARTVFRDGVDRLSLDDDPASPWLLAPRDVRDAIERLRTAGAPLGRLRAASLLLGVKCGCNDAYLVRRRADDGDLALVEGRAPDGTARCGHVERALLRPVLRGEHLHAADGGASEWLVWPHTDAGTPLDALPAAAAAWLAPWRARLTARHDARTTTRWWSACRTAAASRDRPRVVWADVARRMAPRLLAAGDAHVPLNSCYVLACREDADARALAALLASRVAAGWFASVAEPARGGYRRHLAWTVALLPVPHDWARAREILTAPHDGDDVALVARAFDLPADALRPLADWRSPSTSAPGRAEPP